MLPLVLDKQQSRMDGRAGFSELYEGARGVAPLRVVEVLSRRNVEKALH
jgi:hypothetical protein